LEPPSESRILEFEGRLYPDVSYSPNGRFTLALADSSPDGLVFGGRGGGDGAWVLVEGQSAVARGRLQRPNDGAVADSGRFIISDWLFTDRLASRFCAFDPDGRTLLDEELGANAGQSAISPDGRYAVVTTLNNPGHPEWRDLLIAYDLDRGAEMWRVQGARRIQRILIDVAQDLIVLDVDGSAIRTVRLGSGELVSGWEEAVDKFEAIAQLEAEAKAAPDDAAAQESRISRARDLAPQFSNYPGWQARCLRIEGEALERLGRPEEAKAAYLQGLDLDPGLGVRRRLAALSADAPPAPKPATPAPAFVDDRAYATTACPSCGTTLDPLPKAKRKCPHCGEFIWVRGAPDGLRHLLREDQLAANDLAWMQASEAAARAEDEAGDGQRAADDAAGLVVGLYQPEVVGASHYQEAIRRHVPNAEAARDGISVILELAPEPSNRNDGNVVAVLLDGAVVGHISQEEAPLVGAMLRRLGGPGTVRCRGTVQGRGAYPLGVFIDGIPDVYEDR